MFVTVGNDNQLQIDNINNEFDQDVDMQNNDRNDTKDIVCQNNEILHTSIQGLHGLAFLITWMNHDERVPISQITAMMHIFERYKQIGNIINNMQQLKLLNDIQSHFEVNNEVTKDMNIQISHGIDSGIISVKFVLYFFDILKSVSHFI